MNSKIKEEPQTEDALERLLRPDSAARQRSVAAPSVTRQPTSPPQQQEGSSRPGGSGRELNRKHVVANSRQHADNTRKSARTEGLRIKSNKELMLAVVPTQKTQESWERTPTRSSSPVNMKGVISKGGPKIMWVHFQASICTEWEQASMIMRSPGNPESRSFALQADDTTRADVADCCTSSSGDCGDQHTGSSSEHLKFKRPRTIHRCILKTSVSQQDGGTRKLECHVCSSSYSTYEQYHNHLMDSTCTRLLREKKDLAARENIYGDCSRLGLRSLFPVPTEKELQPPLPNKSLRGYRKENGQKDVLRGNRRGRRRQQLGWRRETGPDSDQDVQILSESRPRLKIARARSRSIDGRTGGQTDPEARTAGGRRELEASTAGGWGELEASTAGGWGEFEDRTAGGRVDQEAKVAGGRVDQEAIVAGGRVDQEAKEAGGRVVQEAKEAGGRVDQEAKEAGGRVVQEAKEAGGRVDEEGFLAVRFPDRPSQCGTSDVGSGVIFDDRAASETLLMLSAPSHSPGAGEAGLLSSSPPILCPLGLASPPQLTPLLQASRGQAGSLAFPLLCPCEAARRLPILTVQDNAGDSAKEADMGRKLTVLLMALLGERRLTQLGFPKVDMVGVLHNILRRTKSPIMTETSLCRPQCKVEASLELQRIFHVSKYRLLALEQNIEALLKICVPDKKMWNLFGWKNKSVEDILDMVVENGLNIVVNVPTAE